MLNQLAELLKSQDLCIEAAIAELKSTCCDNKIKVLDYDKICHKFCTKKSSPPKSSDCLILKDNTIYFIEMKNVKEIVVRNKDTFSNQKDFSDFLKNEFKGFRLKDKIVDSLLLLFSICGYYSFNKDFFVQVLNKEIPIKFILLVNLSYEELLTYNIEYLAELENLQFRFIKAVTVINCEGFQEHFK